MKRAAAILALGLAVLPAPACGRKGPLRPPLAAGPQRVERLTARQRAEAVILEWTNPAKAVDGRPVGTLDAVEVWVFDRGLAAGARPATEAEVGKAGRLARRIPRAEFASFRGPAEGVPGSMTFPFVFDPGPAGPKDLAFTVRVLDGKGRASEFAAPVAVAVRPCPKPPWNVEARVLPDHIEIRWWAPESNIDGTKPESLDGYAVYRFEGDGPERRLGATAADVTKYEDRDFRFGRTYRYFIRALAAGTKDEVESGDSLTAEVVARDIFPPAPPADLVAIPAPGAISLSWAAGREEDLAGYRVWRKEPGVSDYIALTPGLLTANAFTDATAAKGKSYVYAVSAVDADGNESPRSECGPVGLKENGA
jgi:hypothetical protein